MTNDCAFYLKFNNNYIITNYELLDTLVCIIKEKLNLKYTKKITIKQCSFVYFLVWNKCFRHILKVISLLERGQVCQVIKKW